MYADYSKHFRTICLGSVSHCLPMTMSKIAQRFCALPYYNKVSGKRREVLFPTFQDSLKCTLKSLKFWFHVLVK